MTDTPDLLVDLQLIRDSNGSLVVAEVGKHVGFPVQRMFAITDVRAGEARGNHAHRDQHQFLTCLNGAVEVTLDNGTKTWTVSLDDPSKGLHIPPMIWGTQHYKGPDTVLLVLCSDHYDESDYIRDHAVFQAALQEGNRKP